jgi:hypothetical protein
MRRFIFTTGLAALLSCAVQAQNTNLAFAPGKLVVYRGGDGVYTIATDRQHPSFLDEYDPALTNQASPIMSIALPTNGANSLWINAHAGSEGQGMTRSADRQCLVISGYHGDLNSIPGTPSSATNSSGQSYPRGFSTIDAFTNYSLTYASAEWFGIQAGITQNNPRGVATDGSNDFWGCGTVAGTQTGGFTESGTLFWNGDEYSDPQLVQNLVQSAYFMRIVNNTLYMVCQTGSGGAQNNGIYTFQQFSFAGGAPVPLPYAPNDVQDVLTTNLFLNFGSYGNIIAFDMDPAGTTVYAADNTAGIVKFSNSGGSWVPQYVFSPTNLGTVSQPKGATGCFGIAVDFSGVNPIIYATTMEEGDGNNTCSNRLISIVDSGDPGSAVVAQTLAVANGINEVFRGVDFTPDLRPLITSQPSSLEVLTNATAVFDVGVQSVYALGYQWQENGTNVIDGGTITGSSTASLTISSLAVSNSGNYSVIVSNAYGVATSLVANLSVSLVPVPPSITNGVANIVNFIGNIQSLSVNPRGTPPFSYQWYFGGTALADGTKYNGSEASSLIVSNLQLTDSGSYSLVISNQGGQISNLLARLTVQYVNPSIPSNGEPASITMLSGQTTALAVSQITGTLPLYYQWYKNTASHPISDGGEYVGSSTSALTITNASTSDAASYYCVITNAGSSVTSTKATVTVIVSPALSYVGYSNQIYFQNFDSLPNPGGTPVNTSVGNVTIGGITYEVANPFDFAYPLYTNITAGASGGLNLAATMPGWYGECDADTTATGSQLGAHEGSQTTGGVISFGTLAPDSQYTNRSLGLIATSSSGGTHFGLKLINQTSNNLDYITLHYTGEYWKLGSKEVKIMSFGYNVDPTGNASTLSIAEINAAATTSNLFNSTLNFSFPEAKQVGPTNGNLAVNQKNLGITNFALATPWTPGSALWLVWSIEDNSSSGEGYGIDNLNFYASSTNTLTPASDFLIPLASKNGVNGVTYSTANGLSFGFSTAPGYASQLSVRSTTNVSLPLSQWINLGHPTEASFGTYQFVDTNAKTNSQTFYTVTSP